MEPDLSVRRKRRWGWGWLQIDMSSDWMYKPNRSCWWGRLVDLRTKNFSRLTYTQTPLKTILSYLQCFWSTVYPYTFTQLSKALTIAEGHKTSRKHNGPESYISSMLYSRDIPFWSGTFNMFLGSFFTHSSQIIGILNNAVLQQFKSNVLTLA